MKLGVMDINHYAKFIQNEILQALADKIRSFKISEERWNPYIATTKYFPEEESGEEYKPFFGNLANISKEIDDYFKEIEGVLNMSLLADANTSMLNDDTQIHAYIVPTLKNKSLNSLKDIIQNVRKFIVSQLNIIDFEIKTISAFVIGFINGIIEVIASLIEGLGAIIGLLNYNNFKHFATSLKKAFNDITWKSFFKLLGNSIKDFFNFIDSDDYYKNVYEFGMFIPRLVDLIINILLAYEGAAKVAGSVVKISKEFSQSAKGINKILTKYLDRIQLKEFSKGFIEKVKESPLKVEVKMDLSIEKETKALTTANIERGLNENKYQIVADNYVVAESNDAKIIEKTFEKLDNNPKALDEAIKKAKKKGDEKKKKNVNLDEQAEIEKKKKKKMEAKAAQMWEDFSYDELKRIPPKIKPCFLAGTLVHTPTGLVPVENIKTGTK